MKLVKKLTKVNCEKYGIEVAPELDFSDDGNKFRGFMYKGLPMTQCYADGTCYLCIRVDYLSNSFTYKEWMQTEEYYLCDEFNGVNEFDIEKLVENLEAVLSKVAELNAISTVPEADLEEAKNVIRKEVEECKRFIENVKANFKWWDAKYTSYIKMISEYMNTLSSKVELGTSILETIDKANVRVQKEYVERAHTAILNSNYKVLGGKFYMEQITKFMNK